MHADELPSVECAPCPRSFRSQRPVVFRECVSTDAAAVMCLIEEASKHGNVMWMLGGIPEPHPSRGASHLIHAVHEQRLIAETRIDGQDSTVGIARYRIDLNHRHCECRVLIRADWRQHGLGEMLMGVLIAKARKAGIRRLVTIANAQDTAMNALTRELGMRSHRLSSRPDDLLHALDL